MFEVLNKIQTCPIHPKKLQRGLDRASAVENRTMVNQNEQVAPVVHATKGRIGVYVRHIRHAIINRRSVCQ